MVNYKSIAEFFEEVVLTEGKLDAQAHIGFMNIHNQTIDELAANAFGGKVLMRPFSDIDEFEKIIYVYDGDDYAELAYKHFNWNEGRHFVVQDVDEQKILCWVIGA